MYEASASWNPQPTLLLLVGWFEIRHMSGSLILSTASSIQNCLQIQTYASIANLISPESLLLDHTSRRTKDLDELMDQLANAQIGSLITNNSNWRDLNVFTNLTSGIPPSKNLQYSTWNSTTGLENYTYLRFNGDVAWPPAVAVDYYFRPNTFSYDATCIYPISGQYGFLNRLLFYLLLVFALAVRKKTWLATAAAGTAMTYAATAAVHAFALLTFVLPLQV